MNLWTAKHLRTLLVGTVALVLSFPLYGQTTRNDVVSVCHSTALNMNKSFDPSKASADLETIQQAADPERRQWIVKQGDLSFVVDSASGRVRTMIDNAAERDLLQRPQADRSKFRNISDGWAAADAIRDALGYDAMTRFRIEMFPNLGEHPTSHRGRVFASYCDVVAGKSTNGNGNSLTLVLDAETGSVLAMSSVSGYTYGPGEALVTEQQAAANAAQAAGMSVDAAVVTGPFWQAPGGKFDQGQGTAYARRNVVRLCYVVGFKPNVQVLVDAATGEVLGGDLAKATNASAGHSDPRLTSNLVNNGEPASKNSPPLIPAGIAVFGAAVVYLLLRRWIR